MKFLRTAASAVRRAIRVSARAVAGLLAIPTIATLLAVQRVVGAVTGNYKTIPNMVYGILRGLFGYKVEFNAASAPIVKDKSVMFLANHLSGADAFVVGGALDGSFVARDDALRVPVVRQALWAINTIGVRRKPEFNGQALGKIVKNFNDGYNTIMFPEGVTSDGKQVMMFHAGLLKFLFNGKAVDRKNRPIELKKDVVVQPVAIRVKEVSGHDAINNDKLRNLYSLPGRDTFNRILKRAQTKSMTLELTVFPPLDPKDFKDAKELATRAAKDIASVVNPGQTDFEKGHIPGYSPEKPQKPAIA